MGGSSRSSTSTPTYTPQTYASPNSSILTGLDVDRNSSVTVTDGGAFDLAGQLLEGTVNASNSAREDSLMFAGESLVNQREAIADAIGAGYTFAGESTQAAYNAMDKNVDKAFTFAGESTNRAFDGMERSQELGYTFSGEAQESAFGFVGEAFQSAMASTESNSDRVHDIAKQSTNNLMENARYSMDHVQEANKSESIEALRMVVLAGVATVGFIAWSNSR